MNKNVWGVFKYRLRYCEMARELINLCTKHPDKTMLAYYIDQKHYHKGYLLFDLDNVSFYLYYLEDDNALFDEICALFSLDNYWYDSDCYELSDERIEELKRRTNETQCLLNNILVMDEGFEKMVYKED